MSLSSYAPSLADPSGSSVLLGAVQWLQGTLLGTIATTVAVIAVASVGLGMLAGRVDIRRGISVVVGCFILFGASSIVGGLRSGLSGVAEDEPVYVAAPMEPAPVARAAPTEVPKRPLGYDPYAGASMPTG